jgi:hypothetical protein
MRRLGALTAAILFSGCRPWCATPPQLWSPSVYGAEAGAVAATDDFIATELKLGQARPRAELDEAARALGAIDAAELASIKDENCLARRDAARFAAARGLRVETAESYLGARFGVRACADR